MSKAALYKGLGVGLMSFGDNLSQQMAESARARREESLAALKRQWQLEDKADDHAFQVGLLDRQEETAERDRQFKIDEQNRADAIAFGRKNQEWELGAPERERAARMDETRMGLLESQTARNEALAANPGRSNSSVEQVRFHMQQLMDQGMNEQEAYEEASRRALPNRPDPQQQAWDSALEEARSALSGDFPEDQLERFGIDSETPILEAIPILAERFYMQGKSLPGRQPEGSGDGSRNNPIPIDSLSGPGDLQVGMYYLINGMTKRWTGEEMQ